MRLAVAIRDGRYDPRLERLADRSGRTPEARTLAQQADAGVEVGPVRASSPSSRHWKTSGTRPRRFERMAEMRTRELRAEGGSVMTDTEEPPHRTPCRCRRSTDETTRRAAQTSRCRREGTT